MTELLRFGFDEDVVPGDFEWPKQRVFINGKMHEKDVKLGGYQLGDHDLPVAHYRAEQERIFGDLHDRKYPVVFFEAETGAGKTSNVPLAAFETGNFDVTYLAEPRIVLAREARKRLVMLAAQVYGQERAEQIIGFATSSESVLHPDNRIIVGTHGYVSGTISHRREEDLVNSLLIVDEFHDREKEGDTVLEVAKALGVPSVVMSATIDTESLSKHHSQYDGTPSPILHMEGRKYSIDERYMDDATKAAAWSLNQGYDTLYLLPRVEDIKLETDRISSRVERPHIILPFHGQQSQSLQDRALLRSYDVPKLILSTKIGSTGLTVGVDVVVIPDLSRTTILGKGGVDSLVLQHPPASEVTQAEGRVSRDRPGGIAIHAPYHLTPTDLPPNPDTYDTPEITRSRADDLILHLGTAGLRLGNMSEVSEKIAKKLDYKDLPSDQEVERSLTRLRHLGALSIDNMLTDIAYEMAKLPVDSQLKRMIVASREYSEEVHRYMIIAACVAQFNGVVALGQEASGNRLSNERRADMLRDLDVFLRALDMHTAEQDMHGILPQRIERIIAHANEICKREGIDELDGNRLPDEDERQQLLKSMATGIEEIFVRKGKGKYRDPRDGRITRQLLAESAVRRAARVAGVPWNLETITRSGKLTRRHFITRGMEVDMSQLSEIVPGRSRYEECDYEVAANGKIMTHHEVYFDDRPTGYHKIMPAEKVTEGLRNFVIKGLFQQELKHEELLPEVARKFRQEVAGLRKLEHRATYEVGVEYLLEELQKEMERDLPGTADDLEELLRHVDINQLRSFLSNKERSRITATSPEKILVQSDNGVGIKLSVEYKDKAAMLHLPDFATLRDLPSYIPELDGRRVFVRIGSETRVHDFYEAKEKYRLNRSDRRKSDNRS